MASLSSVIQLHGCHSCRHSVDYLEGLTAHAESSEHQVAFKAWFELVVHSGGRSPGAVEGESGEGGLDYTDVKRRFFFTYHLRDVSENVVLFE